MERVAILGASPKPDRYAYKALKMLEEYGHQTFPVNPAIDTIEEAPVYKSLTELTNIDTVTLYVNPKRGMEYLEQLLALKPKRVIMNPGTESDEMQQQLEAADIAVTIGCTLVMLRTSQY